MIRLFSNVVSAAESGEKSAIRALQAWQYLIAKASNRQIVRYDELRVLMGYSDNRPLSTILGCIMFYCEQNELPPLTLIVVNQSGIPGEGFTAEQLENYHQRREDVFGRDWYNIVPPSIAEFRDAYMRGSRAA
jgi:hypothetical protein